MPSFRFGDTWDLKEITGLIRILALMRHTSCLNKFYYPTDDRNMKAKLFIQKCTDDYQLTRELIRKPH